MNTIKNIIITYRWWLLLACLASQFFGCINLLNIAISGTSEVNNSNAGAYNDMLFLFMITGCVVSYVITELRSVTIYLLPASTLRKYATAFGVIVITVVSSLLFSMVIEFIGSLLTAGSPQAASFAIGGYIRYASESTFGYSILAAIMGFHMNIATMIKNRNAVLGINFLMSACAWILAIFLHSIGSSPIFHFVFWGFAIIFFIASYQTYKRWEPVNSGLYLI